jgi:hypothetical protein
VRSCASTWSWVTSKQARVDVLDADTVWLRW